MKPRRPTEFEVFNSNVKQAIIKSDSVTEDVQKSRIPYRLDTYLGTSGTYFSDNGIQYIEGKQDIVFRMSSIPLRANAYSKLQSSTYCKPFVKPGSSFYGDGVKKYYSTPSFSSGGTVLGVNRYLYVENNGSSINYYFLGDGTDGTVSGTKYYIRPDEIINNYLVPFKTAITEDKIIYPILIFIDGFFIPWSRCYFAISYESFNIYINMADLKYDDYSYLVDRVRTRLVTRDIDPVFYLLPFEVNYGENVEYSKINQAKTIFAFDSYGRLYYDYSNISNSTKMTYVEALINIKNIYEVSTTDMYDQVSDLFYCEVGNDKGTYSPIGKTVVDFNKLDRMRKIFPNNIIVFNRTDDSNLNLTLCTDTIRIYNNIVYVGNGTDYYDQHIKVFFDYNSALSLTNLEFVSQSWLQNYTDALVNFYITYNINYSDSGEQEVQNNENRSIGLKVVDGILNAEYDPKVPEDYDLPDATQLGYTIKEGILCLEYDELNPNKLIINDNYISEQLNSGSLLVRSSMDMDTYDFDELNCYYYNALENSRTQLPINKSVFFNLYNKIYHNDIYNKNKGKLPIMDQTIITDQIFEIRDIGTLNSIYNYYVGQNLTLNNMSFDDEVFTTKALSTTGGSVGKFKFVYIANNERNDRYGYTTIDSDLQPGSTINPDSIKMRSAKFVADLMKDDFDSPLGLEVGYRGYLYSAKVGYTVYTDYTYTIVANIENYTDSNGKLIKSVEVYHDDEHDSYYFTLNNYSYYVKEYSNEYYDEDEGRVVDKTGTYLLDKEYQDFSGMMTILYDKDAVVNEARMNNVQLSNSEITVYPNESTTVNLTDVNLQINVEKYTSNFDYSLTTDIIITTFVCTDGGSLTYENVGASVTVSDESLLYNTFGNRVGNYQFDYDGSQWVVNGSLTFATLAECGITYSGTDTFVIVIENDTYPTWTLDDEDVNIDEVYGIKFNGICNFGDILSITFSKIVTGLVEETYDPDAINCQTIMNDYLQLKLVDGVTNIVYDNYPVYDTVDPYKYYPGRIEFVYDSDNNEWTVTVYKYVTDDLIYKSTFTYGDLEGFAIEYEGSPVDGDMIIIYYDPPVFQWNLYKGVPTNTDSFVDGYLYPDEPTVENVDLAEYGIGLMATITQTSIINAKIYNEDLLVTKFYGESGTYIFRYNEELGQWLYQNTAIGSIREYGIDINGSMPVDGDYVIAEINTSNTPSWMDSLFVTVYDVDVNCIEFPDGTYYDKETAASIILDSYGADISEYLPYIKGNDKIIMEYHNSVGIPRYILNLLINKFNYYETFKTDESDVEDTYLTEYASYDEKVADIFKNYKLYEYQLSTMMLNNQSIFDKYLKEVFSNNLRFAEYTKAYLLNNVAKLIENRYYIDIPVKNRYAYMMDFENMFLNFYTNNNLTRAITSNIFRYQLALDRYSSENIPVEFMFFDNINNSELVTKFQDTNKFKWYDPEIFNENMRLYTTEIPEGNEFIYPESEDEYPITMEFNVDYSINKIRYKGILKPGASAGDTIYTPAASKGDFYYLDYPDDDSDFINEISLYDLFLPQPEPEPEPEPTPDPDDMEDNDNEEESVVEPEEPQDEPVDPDPPEPPPQKEEVHATYKILLCVKDTYNAKEAVFSENKPSIDGSTSWVLVSAADLIDGFADDYSFLVLDHEYINITLNDPNLYNTDITVVSNNRFMYHQFVYVDPTGDYGAIDNDTNAIVLEDENHNDLFKYCDDSSRYMVFIANKEDDTHTDYRYISSDQYRVSIPSNYNAPYYKRKMFFTFNIPEDSYIAVFYIPISMQAVEFKQRAVYQDGTIIFDISYESKKDVHYTLNSELYMVFADGKKIPQSWVKKIGPDRLSIRDPNNTGSISYNNISIVKYLPTTLDSRFDTFIDSNELTTIGDFDPTSDEFMKYIVKVGLNKNDILNIIEKLAYRHRYASTGTSYYIDDTLTLNNYGSGMAEFVYWLYNDISSSSEQKLTVFNYDAINMNDIDSFAENNKFIESTVKLIREFYIENTLVPYNTHEDPAPTFSYHDNIAAKSENLSSNNRYANNPANIYVYPVLQDYRFDVIYGTYHLFNLTTNARTVINPGEVDYTFYIYSVNSSILPDHIRITIDSTGVELVSGRDYSYNAVSGQVIIFSIVDNFTVTAYGERVSYIEITKQPDKTAYYTTERFDPTGMLVVIHWVDGSTEYLTDYTYSHYNELLTVDIDEIIITYRDSDYFDYTARVRITVQNATPELNYTLSDDGTYYLVGDGTNGSGLTSIPENASVIIPDSVYDVENNIVYRVQGIRDGAFKNLNGIDTISTGIYLYDIGEYAFSGCSVSNVILNQGLLTIGNGAFKDCENIGTITIPNTVVSTGISIFKGCTNLSSVTISNKITALPQTMFEDCTSLTRIVLPSSVTSIGLECFSGCTALETVQMTNYITSIAEKAFYNCSSLASINIPTNINMTTIKENTFAGCGLVSITIPNNITMIENNAFSDCTSLASAVFQSPDNVKPGIENLGKLIFSGCTSLTSVEFGFTASVDKCNSEDDAWFKNCSTSLLIKVPIAIYNPSESLDLTTTNYGTKWTYISAGNDATYYSSES